MEFLIEIIKTLVMFIVCGVGIGFVILAVVVAKEAAWVLKNENRKKYEKQEEEEKW